MTAREKAIELMTLAMGVGISNKQSIDLMTAKLEEWDTAAPEPAELIYNGTSLPMTRGGKVT